MLYAVYCMLYTVRVHFVTAVPVHGLSDEMKVYVKSVILDELCTFCFSFAVAVCVCVRLIVHCNRLIYHDFPNVLFS